MAKGTASLFHPKPSRPTLPKKDSPSTNTPSPGPSQSTPGTPKKAATPATRPPQQRPPRPLGIPPFPKPKPKADDDEKKQALPDGPYAEFRLMSSKLNGWKYDVMKFESRKRVDINTWAAPVKLNRKEPRREDAPDAASLQAVSAMVGSDGKLVIGADGKVVMVDAAGRPVRAPVDADEAGEEKGKGKDKKKRFVKKTRQVFLVPEETRQLRREERHPWVMEDAKHDETWVGKMEEVSKSQTYAMFMPAADDVFKFVPAHRWYKFQKKPHYHIPNLEEAETLVCTCLSDTIIQLMARYTLDDQNAEAQGYPLDAPTKNRASHGWLISRAQRGHKSGARRSEAEDGRQWPIRALRR